jgi:hypothetical protein
MKCEHGIENCVHLGSEHDEDSCFNGWWEHEYVCQECGNTLMSRKFSTTQKNGVYVAPDFKPRNCTKCKTPQSMT